MNQTSAWTNATKPVKNQHYSDDALHVSDIMLLSHEINELVNKVL